LKTEAGGHWLLHPAAEGWRLIGSNRAVTTHADLAEAAAAIPARDPWTLALPGSMTIFERLTLPSRDREELAGMVLLQLEKTLPYPIEETTYDFVVVREEEEQSIVTTIAAPTQQIEQLAGQLRGRLPDDVKPWPLYLAAAVPSEAPGAMLYVEQGRTFLAICENGCLAHLQPVDARPDASFSAHFGQLLLAAELEGVPVEWEWLQLAPECNDYGSALLDATKLTPGRLPEVDGTRAPAATLMPAQWKRSRERRAARVRWKGHLIRAGVAYACALLLFWGWILALHLRAQSLERRIAGSSTEVDFLMARQARWNALAPAVDPARSIVEMLDQINRSLPSPEIRITLYDQTPQDFRIEGEAPTAAQAIDFVEQLKANPAFADFKFESGPPDLLPDEHARFRISATR
jgi:hypothetical protein